MWKRGRGGGGETLKGIFNLYNFTYVACDAATVYNKNCENKQNYSHTVRFLVNRFYSFLNT